MKVFIYRNLNYKGHVYSIKSMEGITRGRVIGYASRIIVKNAQLIVSEAGRNRVLTEKRKNVHAGVVGELNGINSYIERIHISNLDKKVKFYTHEQWWNKVPLGTPITYNPYLYNTFVDVLTKQPVIKAQRVIFSTNSVGIIA